MDTREFPEQPLVPAWAGAPDDEEDFGAALDPSADATRLQQNILTTSTAAGPIVSVDISAWLNGQYAGGASVGDFVFLRLSPTGNSAIFDVTNGYLVATADDPDAADRPFIDYTVAIPTPAALPAGVCLTMLALAISRRRRSREP